MYKEIENILVRTLSPFEYTKIEELKKQYTEEEIITAYKNSPVKHINYIIKYISTHRTPSWLKENIVNQDVDNETQKEFEDFNNFIKEFRNDTNNNI